MATYRESPLNDDDVSTDGSESGYVYINTLPRRPRRRMRSDLFAAEQTPSETTLNTKSEKADEDIDEQLDELFSEMLTNITVDSVRSSGFLEVEENRSLNCSLNLSLSRDDLTCESNAGALDLCEKCTTVDRDKASHFCPQCNMKFCVCCFREHAKWMSQHQPTSLSRWKQTDHATTIDTYQIDNYMTEFQTIADDPWVLKHKETNIESAKNIGFSSYVDNTEMIPVEAVGSAHFAAPTQTSDYNNERDKVIEVQNLGFDGKQSQPQYTINKTDVAGTKTSCVIDMCVPNTDTVFITDTATNIDNDQTEICKTELNVIREDEWVSKHMETSIEPDQTIGCSSYVVNAEVISVEEVESSHSVVLKKPNTKVKLIEIQNLGFDISQSHRQYSINIKDEEDNKTCCIIDMCVLNTDTIVIADTANCKLTEILITTMEKKRSHLLNDYPRALAHIRNMCLLLAYPQGKLSYKDLDDDSEWSSQIQLEGQECSSICVDRGKIYISIPMGIHVYDTTTESHNLHYDFKIEYGEIMASTQKITVSGDIVIVSDPSHGLLFIDTHTNTISNEIEMSEKPTAVCLGSAGDLYVACAKSVDCVNDGVVIRRFGIEFEIYAPFAVCF